MMGKLVAFFAPALALMLFSVPLRAGNLEVVASVFPLMEFAREVGAERVSVSLMVPPGAEPHSWEPRPSDIIRLKSAGVFIYTGAGMEHYLKDILAVVRGSELEVMDASKGLALLRPDAGEHGHAEEGHGPFDPHIWLDLGNDINIVRRIADLFSRKDPRGRAVYTRNAEAYIERLKALDGRFREELARCLRREFFHGGHAAFGYLAKRYGLRQVALHGPNPDAEPTPREMARIVDAAKNKKARVIYFEELVNPRLAEVLAREAGARTLALDPGANVSFDDLKRGVTFIEIMEKNLRNLKEGLECE